MGNLTADDFRLFDEGKPQTISRFSVEKFETSASVQVKASAPVRASGATPVTAEGGVSGTPPDRFVALLLDDVSAELRDFLSGRNAGLHFIGSLRPNERMAIYTTSGNHTLEFTSDREQLRNTLAGIRPINRQTFYDSVMDSKLQPCPLSPYLADFVANRPEIKTGCMDDPIVQSQASGLLQKYGDPDALGYFRALTGLVAKMAAMPGQRAILLASPGLYVPTRFQKQLTGVLADAIRAKVVISAIDPRGVTTSGTMVAGGSVRPVASKLQLMAQEQELEAFMDEVSSGTGGVYVHGNNDLDGAMERVDAAPESVYLLAFSPTNIKFDGKRHQLKVSLVNGRGLTLQARTSYFADGYTENPEDQMKQQIQEAFFSNQELMGLPVRLQTQFFKDGDDATLTVNARVDATKLPFRKEDGRNRDDLTLVVGLFDQNGNFVSAYQKTIEMRLKDETLSAWLRSGIENSTDFTVKPGKYLVRLVVRDSEGSSMAEQSTGVDIPW